MSNTLFYLIIHAYFKALLFLGSRSIIHSINKSQISGGRSHVTWMVSSSFNAPRDPSRRPSKSQRSRIVLINLLKNNYLFLRIKVKNKMHQFWLLTVGCKRTTTETSTQTTKKKRPTQHIKAPSFIFLIERTNLWRSNTVQKPRLDLLRDSKSFLYYQINYHFPGCSVKKVEYCNSLSLIFCMGFCSAVHLDSFRKSSL